MHTINSVEKRMIMVNLQIVFSIGVVLVSVGRRILGSLSITDVEDFSRGVTGVVRQPVRQLSDVNQSTILPASQLGRCLVTSHSFISQSESLSQLIIIIIIIVAESLSRVILLVRRSALSRSTSLLAIASHSAKVISESLAVQSVLMTGQ